MKWIDFVMNVAKERNIKFNEALKVASAEYHKKNGTQPKPKKEKVPLEDRLTGRKILKVIKRKLDNGSLKGGMKKSEIIEELKKPILSVKPNDTITISI